MLPGKRSADEGEKALDLRPTAMENAEFNGAEIVYLRAVFVVFLNGVFLQGTGRPPRDAVIRSLCSLHNCYTGCQKRAMAWECDP